MTLEETKRKWKISYERLCAWVSMGIIPEIEIVDGIVEIRGNKPFVPKNKSKITVDSVRKYILKACSLMQYIDYRILGIEQDKFKAIISQLEESNYIRKDADNVDCLSNKYFTITELGETFLKKGNFKLKKLGFDLNFSYMGITAEINGELERV